MRERGSEATERGRVLEGMSPSHGRELFQFLALNGAIWCILKGLFFTYFEIENGNIPSISSVVLMREIVRQTL